MKCGPYYFHVQFETFLREVTSTEEKKANKNVYGSLLVKLLKMRLSLLSVSQNYIFKWRPIVSIVGLTFEHDAYIQLTDLQC